MSFQDSEKNGGAPVPKAITHILDWLFVILSGQARSPGQVDLPYLKKSSLLHHRCSFDVIIMKHVMALNHLYYMKDKKQIFILCSMFIAVTCLYLT